MHANPERPPASSPSYGFEESHKLALAPRLGVNAGRIFINPITAGRVHTSSPYMLLLQAFGRRVSAQKLPCSAGNDTLEDGRICDHAAESKDASKTKH